MQALRLHGKSDIRLDQIPIPQCAPDQVRVQIAYCGICGSDIHEYVAGPVLAPAVGETNQYNGANLPITMGHEMSGTVIEMGKNTSGFEIGEKVVINPLLTDFDYGTSPCLSCSSGRRNTCKRATYYGINAPGGGFSSQITVSPSSLVPVPEAVSLKAAALSEPLAVASHMIRESEFTAGQNVLILGAGPIGLALLMMLRSKQVGKIFVSEVSNSRIQQARRFGADNVINPIKDVASLATDGNLSDPVLEAIHAVLEEGVDIAFDASGLQSTLDTAIASVRPGGTIFNVAIHEKPLLLNLNSVSLAEKRVTGGICYTNEDFEDVLSQLATNSIVMEEMITAIVPLADIVRGGFLELINNRAQHVKILVQTSPNGDNLSVPSKL